MFCNLVEKTAKKMILGLKVMLILFVGHSWLFWRAFQKMRVTRLLNIFAGGDRVRLKFFINLLSTDLNGAR
jgi:hypothetical protein